MRHGDLAIDSLLNSVEDDEEATQVLHGLLSDDRNPGPLAFLACFDPVIVNMTLDFDAEVLANRGNGRVPSNKEAHPEILDAIHGVVVLIPASPLELTLTWRVDELSNRASLGIVGDLVEALTGVPHRHNVFRGLETF